MKGISCRGNHISFGRYALKALEPTWITARQIEAGRRAMTRYVRRGGFPTNQTSSVRVRPAERPMGSGKALGICC